MAKRVQSSLSPFRRNYLRFPRILREAKLNQDYSQDLLPVRAKEVHSKIQKKTKTMKKTTVAEVIVKVLVAALTAFLTALGTTSCMK